MLKAAGIHAILDHHALPGVSSSNFFQLIIFIPTYCSFTSTVNQMFAGNCTSNVQFYNSPNDYNYQRAVTWSIVMAWLSHVHPAFKNVFAIEAINEPLQDYSLTPGLDRCVWHPYILLGMCLFTLIHHFIHFDLG
jgi:hypothetical protein